MRAFRDGRLDILVSTAVVEVGIDVANATVMLVEGADRFGLSQLHQFRGRVGRGEHQSYCILLSENQSEEVQERLRLMESIYDGFRLAEEDLRLRGPGEYFGTRQTGRGRPSVGGRPRAGSPRARRAGPSGVAAMGQAHGGGELGRWQPTVGVVERAL